MLLLDKSEGSTPLQTLTAFREKNPEYQDSILSYAGRLDPMASGLLLILEGAENNRRSEFLRLDKEYEVEILFGFATDTHDILGIVNEIAKSKSTPSSEILTAFVGTYQQQYPAYSSKTVDGIPLHAHARQGNAVIAPKKEITIHDIRSIEVSLISKEALQKELSRRISLVSGDFRQDTILGRWGTALQESVFSDYHIEKISVSCTSGTYMRSLAHEIGKREGVPALAYSIRRTKIGPYRIEDAGRS